MATRSIEFSYKNGFALALYERLRRQPGNLCFSPFSIRTALGMTYAGARGGTASEMGRVLDLPPSDETLHALVGDLLGRLESSGGAAAMNVANSLWSQEGAPLQSDFATLVSRHYGAPVNLVDFRRDSETARGAINRWVEKATRERIRELIPAGGVSSETRLALVNAVFFKASWELPFAEDDTQDAPFHLEGGATANARLMFQRKRVRYFEDHDLQAVELPYRGEDLSMMMALPRRKNGLSDLEARLTAQSIDRWLDRMGHEEVKLHVPRFKISWGTVDLQEALVATGIAAAFDPVRADFSGINGHPPPDAEALSISSVFHQAFVEVDEEGTEAAAATAVAMATLAAPGFRLPPPVRVFRADHPFLFAIRHRSSGAILFLGRVSDPSSER